MIFFAIVRTCTTMTIDKRGRRRRGDDGDVKAIPNSSKATRQASLLYTLALLPLSKTLPPPSRLGGYSCEVARVWSGVCCVKSAAFVSTYAIRTFGSVCRPSFAPFFLQCTLDINLEEPIGYPAQPGLIRPSVRPSVHACRLDIQHETAQAQQIR